MANDVIKAIEQEIENMNAKFLHGSSASRTLGVDLPKEQEEGTIVPCSLHRGFPAHSFLLYRASLYKSSGVWKPV